VSFTVNATDPTRLLEFSFGEGANLILSGAPRDAIIVHVFRAAGTYVVTATAKDSFGHSSSATVTITVM
jgi:PKD repeat protein